ncbi:septal ring lytic transglycosylase RlpA family protein [Pelagibius litoralis]|uniref:Endolytic peptidoglycan transglycosylase RlpA n=1 Tax=Pelagibius litoralis TaxID=374515 RepID=A0A967EVY5_9PROT|nr:septal ring lytic transglycosylase RlpA family protein [Pelagibius litoralis]NIA68719.1 septal ring lytic transglycosylase RlpA family protein [Pelagibius litoralis]
MSRHETGRGNAWSCLPAGFFLLALGLLAGCAAPQTSASIQHPTESIAVNRTEPKAPGAQTDRAPALAALPPSAKSGAAPREEETVSARFTGLASWYGKRFHGRLTASGTRFDMAALTAAHRSLPFGTRVRVINQANQRSVVVTINDRGPFIKGRVIDLSRAAARELAFIDSGVTKVRVEVLAEAAR